MTEHGFVAIDVRLTGTIAIHPENFNEYVMELTEDSAREFRNKFYAARQ